LEAAVEGYPVATYSGKKLGEVVAADADYYIVEYGRFMKTRRPLPKKNTVLREAEQEILSHIPREEFCASPLIRDVDSFDRKPADDYYGLIRAG
jgi:hypothetical protein